MYIFSFLKSYVIRVSRVYLVEVKLIYFILREYNYDSKIRLFL